MSAGLQKPRNAVRQNADILAILLSKLSDCSDCYGSLTSNYQSYAKRIKRVTTSSFERFILSNQICVIRAQVGVGLGFNKILKVQLEQNYKGLVNVGWLNTATIDYKNKAIQNFVKVAIPKIGLPKTNAVFPG